MPDSHPPPHADHARQPGACITLLGMPASGKSTVGRLLAASLGIGFRDTDHDLEAAHGKPLGDIVAAHGDEAFLDLERDAVLAVAATPACVVAPGGSVVYRPAAVAHLRALGCIVYLDVPLSAIAQRIGDPTARGVVLPPGDTLADLYARRTPLYAQAAHRCVDCADTTPEQAAARVRAALTSPAR